MNRAVLGKIFEFYIIFDQDTVERHHHENAHNRVLRENATMNIVEFEKFASDWGLARAGGAGHVVFKGARQGGLLSKQELYDVFVKANAGLVADEHDDTMNFDEFSEAIARVGLIAFANEFTKLRKQASHLDHETFRSSGGDTRPLSPKEKLSMTIKVMEESNGSTILQQALTTVSRVHLRYDAHQVREQSCCGALWSLRFHLPCHVTVL